MSRKHPTRHLALALIADTLAILGALLFTIFLLSLLL